jgi:hypothetical protein
MFGKGILFKLGNYIREGLVIMKENIIKIKYTDDVLLSLPWISLSVCG